MFEGVFAGDVFGRIMENKALLLVLAFMALYAAFAAFRVLKSGKSDYEKDIERILTSDKHKVKGRFE